ncbi:hypothetical protein EW026_g7930 [Hermanssonia centrifuga]|uniref:Uncharacterized protein n=1 Tax=Hermanssonia centrifuga TaxID=98765 RepID=A0A4S4K672_9APHY|nr:hypothetical protein EW026_g7930 [Hermanssonia centrifuga]
MVQALKDDLMSTTQDVRGMKERLKLTLESLTKMEKERENSHAEWKDVEKGLREQACSLHEHSQRLATEKDAYKADFHKANATIERLQGYLHRHRGLEKELEENRRTNANLSRELKALRLEQRDQGALLQIRSAELRDAQALLDKTDLASHADVLRMVEKLNSEIFQISALITDSVRFGGVQAEQGFVVASYATAERFIGPALSKLLTEGHHREDPICVQIALQALLVTYVSWIITSWDVTLSHEQRKLLQKLHARIFETDAQVVSAKWRSLTRRSLTRVNTNSLSDLTGSLTTEILQRITDVLIISKVDGDYQGVHRSFVQDFEDKVRNVVDLSQSTSKAIGEDVISTDFQIIAPYCGDPFIADSMENEYGGGRGEKGSGGQSEMTDSFVLCTTQLGLRRCEKSKIVQTEGEDEVKTIVLLKTKVALSSMIAEMEKGEGSSESV